MLYYLQTKKNPIKYSWKKRERKRGSQSRRRRRWRWIRERWWCVVCYHFWVYYLLLLPSLLKLPESRSLSLVKSIISRVYLFFFRWNLWFFFLMILGVIDGCWNSSLSHKVVYFIFLITDSSDLIGCLPRGFKNKVTFVVSLIVFFRFLFLESSLLEMESDSTRWKSFNLWDKFFISDTLKFVNETEFVVFMCFQFFYLWCVLLGC